jgi:hypothetical protein
MTPEASRSVACEAKRNPSSTLGERLNPRRAPQENASLGSTRIGALSLPPTFTPSLNVQPAVPLSSTLGSCAHAAEPASKHIAATAAILRFIYCLLNPVPRAPMTLAVAKEPLWSNY